MKYIGIIFLITFLACKKDEPVIPCIDECLGANYNNYSTNNFDFIKQHLIGQSPFGPSANFIEPYSYSSPVFNPNNDYEIAYAKKDVQTDKSEVWKFNFCTGESTKLSDNFFYNLDWGSNGWLLYTAKNQQIYKVKENGDSLTRLSTQNGFNRAGKWNPSGTQYYTDGKIMNSKGELIKDFNLFAINWISDDLLLVSESSKYKSYSQSTENLIELNFNQMNAIATNIFDKKNMACYISLQNGTAQDDYLVKYSLDGSNKIDTIKNLYDSYYYIEGDIANNKIITQLRRQHWQDSIADIRYFRENILIMDIDGSNERLINLP